MSTPLSAVLFPHLLVCPPIVVCDNCACIPLVNYRIIVVAAFFLCFIFLPAMLMLFFFFLPNLHGFLLSRILPLACVGKLDLPAVSRGPSPLPEPAPAGDIVTGESSCFTFTASLFPFLFYEGCSQTSFCMVLGSACTRRPDLYFQRMHASRMWIHS